MEYILLLNKFKQDNLAKKLESLNIKILNKEEGNLIIKTENIDKLLELQEISKILKVTTDWKKFSFTTLKIDSLNSIKDLKQKNYKIQTKFYDKIKISAKSIYKHINPYLKYESFIPNEENPEIILYIEIKKENNQILYRLSHSLIEWYKIIKPIKMDYSKFIVVIENPSLVEEVSDFLRVCWIFKITLYIITKDIHFDKILKNAKEITKGIEYEKMKFVISNKIPEDYILVGFSKLARQNEIELKNLLKKENKKIALVFGDDKFGLTQETRDKMQYNFRLTPEIKKPLKASQALSYILGIYTSIKLE